MPPFSLTKEIQDELRRQTHKLAIALNVQGLMNVQFAIKDELVYVLEVNPRASRTVPFVSKATARPLAKIAAKVMVGMSLEKQGINGESIPDYYSVKEAVFPFVKFPGVDTVLGPEMKSTGEVMGIGQSFGEAFYKSQQGCGLPIPASGRALLSVKKSDQLACIEVAQYLASAGFELSATEGTARVIASVGLQVERVNKVKEGRPHVVDRIKNKSFDIIVNTTEGKQSLEDSYTIRREALLHKVTYFTTMAGARAACEAHRSIGMTRVNRLQSLHREIDQ